MKVFPNLQALHPFLEPFHSYSIIFNREKLLRELQTWAQPEVLQFIMLSPPFSSLYNFQPIFLVKLTKVEHTDLNEREHLGVF